MLTEEKRQELITEFEKLLMETGRDGVERLIAFIRKSDFYTAPASTRFHCCYEGALLEHSMNVFKRLEQKMTLDPIWKEIAEKKNYTRENIIISTLLHDLCKTYYYVKDFKNQKTYDEEKVNAAEAWQVKSDNNGRFIWETVTTYTVDDKIPMGHGSKSVFMAEEYIKLQPCERYAIRWHMGAYDVTPSEQYTLGKAVELHPLVLAIHEADEEATHLMELQ